MREVYFSVDGDPQPQGSIRGFKAKNSNRIIMTSDNKGLKFWRDRVATEAQKAVPSDFFSDDSAYKIKGVFRFLRPKSKPKRVTEMLTKPDIDKLARAVLDSLTGICYKDDNQVTGIGFVKIYADGRPGLDLWVVKEA